MSGPDQIPRRRVGSVCPILTPHCSGNLGISPVRYSQVGTSGLHYVLLDVAQGLQTPRRCFFEWVARSQGYDNLPMDSPIASGEQLAEYDSGNLQQEISGRNLVATLGWGVLGTSEHQVGKYLVVAKEKNLVIDQT